MNCIAVDDEPFALKLLADNISRVPFLKLVAACPNAMAASEALQAKQVDLMFADIQMPGLNGMQLVASLVKKPMVIFVTAYKQHAFESYDLDVVDYLLKPVSLDRFIKACNRAKEFFHWKTTGLQDCHDSRKDHIFLQADAMQVKVRLDDIAWMEGLREYIRVQLLRSNRPLVVRTSLRAMEAALPVKQFIRIHKSYLLSVAAITAIRKYNIFIGDREFPVGETYKAAVERLVQGR
jgi:two-component system LytT family response regulator